MFGIPKEPESVAVIADGQEVFLSFHFTFPTFFHAKVWAQFLEGFVIAEAERVGLAVDTVEFEVEHGPRS
jgi:hypothetical protein